MIALLRRGAVVFLLAGAACSGSPSATDGGVDAGVDAGLGERQGCLSGAEYPCDCDGGPTGAMECLEDGGFGACQCPLPPGEPDGGDAG
ncbi:MAG TPA: hypothetical protein VMB50_10245 [Myxococcales bacterium]|nr:hypothetical protein [Myxococcales bacterium]